MIVGNMWIEGLTKAEREFEMKSFHPEFYEGEYVKITVCQKSSDGQIHPPRISFFKLDKMIKKCCWEYPFCEYKGLGYQFNQICLNKCYISYYWDKHTQTNVDIISKDAFIKGIKSQLPENLKEIINFDKL